jgi:hypothetical protein
MLDWLGIFAAGMWIAGLALLLALLSLARSFRPQPIHLVLAQPAFRAAIAGGIALFAIGMCLTVGSWFERVGWLVVVLLSLWQGASGMRDLNRGGG